MAIDWNELITIAEELGTATANADVSKEAYKRSSINRAYYGAIHLAETVLLSEGIPQSAFDQARSWHVFIIRKFKDSGNKNRKGIGRNLDTLRVNRVKADYDQNINNIDWDCTAYLVLAKKLERWLAAL